MLKTLLI